MAHVETLNRVIFFFLSFGAAVCTTSEHLKETNDNCVIIEYLGLEEVGYVFRQQTGHVL